MKIVNNICKYQLGVVAIKFFMILFIINGVISCGDDDNEETKKPEEKSHIVKYEVSIPSNKYQMRITYVEYKAGEVKTVEIKDKTQWSFEMKNVKDVSFIYVSCLATSKNAEANDDEEIDVTVSVYIDNKLKDSKTDKNFCAIGDVTGVN